MAQTELTKQQQAVVDDRGGALLVSAAAGSGKTRVLVERLFSRITEENCHVDDFLMITYTKAAAAELRSKIASELSGVLAKDPTNLHIRQQMFRIYRAEIKTIDAFCTALLRENTHLLAREEDRYALTPDFRVMDEEEARTLREQVLNRVLEQFYQNMDSGSAALADTLGAGRDDRNLVQLVLEIHEKLQSHAYPEQWLEKNKRIWADCDLPFDDTVYAGELLRVVRRTAAYSAQRLSDAADSIQEDVLIKSYGEKFRFAACGFSQLLSCDCWETARSALKGIEFQRLSTPKGRKEDPEICRLKRIWESCKAAYRNLSEILSVSAADAAEDLQMVAPAMQALLSLAERFGAAYRKEKLRINSVDFSDQEHLALYLLVQPDGQPTELGRQISDRYREILVDEYQDTNEVQNAIFQAVSRDGKNLFTVGDVKQSIYRFRLADPTIFLKKYQAYRSYETAEKGEPRKILLSKNFRSRQEILDAANFIFSNMLSPEMGEMEYGEDEALYFGAEYYPERQDCQTEFHLIDARRRSEKEEDPVRRTEAEARLVARRIRQLLDEGYPVTGRDGALRPCQPEDIVILLRFLGSRVEEYAAALREENIPCSFHENAGFFHTMEISVIISLLEIVDNPHQDIPLLCVLRSPVFGFTPDRLAQIRAKHPEGDFYDALAADAEEDTLAFFQTLNKLRLAARDMQVYTLIWHIYNTLCLLGIFGAMSEGLSRQENLIAFSGHARKWEEGGYRGLFAFVTHLRELLQADRMPATKQQAAVTAGVQLMSIHKSKGLEFPVVILPDLDHTFSRLDYETPVLMHPELGLGPQYVDLRRRICYPTLARQAVEERLRRENLAEEQRILYVAMTRPKEKLILVDSVYNAKGKLQKLAALASCPALPEAVAEGKNFGDWLLMLLLCRPEAALLRQFAETEVEQLYCGDSSPWQVFLHDAEAFRRRAVSAETRPAEPAEERHFEPDILSYVYPYQRQTRLPAKITATEMKGRLLDEEIARDSWRAPRIYPLSRPKFRRESHGLTAAERGTATHLALQYLDFEDLRADGQIERLRREGRLTPQQADSVNVQALQRFLLSPLADEIRQGKQLLREYRFTVLMEAERYDPQAAGSGDKMLLQGVVDCCFETEDGFTVVDFKTDEVRSSAQTAERTERYRSQLEAYSLALERVLERPVNRRILYFLHTGETVEV